jgi:hypothetical protein
MASGLGYGMYGLGLVFYIVFLRESDRLAREARPDEPAKHLQRASWLTLWREHRSRHPYSDLRRRLVVQVAMTCVFVAGGAVLTTIDGPQSSHICRAPESSNESPPRHAALPAKPGSTPLPRA